ncbi:SDR family NAD(P)-dependent oxidoreductase [Nitrospirillum viridazoti]|uniref:SDR family NAD(P)-dependent oxidoreductase n=1 Tax=Nitrospirillum viridazoti TaxID=3144925 RepID=UPI0018E9B4D1|nr:SDR family NAD(P)-dependent oxidoreductase [Nitrospirillum amazonense]
MAIITGGRQGIGRGVADLLAKRGAKVVMVNRTDAADVADAIGHGAIAIAADITSEAAWAKVASTVESAFGRADILVHAAGAHPMATLEQMTPEAWRSVMALILDAHLMGDAPSCRS